VCVNNISLNIVTMRWPYPNMPPLKTPSLLAIFGGASPLEALHAGALTYINFVSLTASVGRTPPNASWTDSLETTFKHKFHLPMQLVYNSGDDLGRLKASATRYSAWKKLRAENR